MLELLRESLLPVNLPFTLLLGAVAVYWIIGLLGLVDLEGPDGIDGFGDGTGGEGAGDGVGEGADGIEGPDGGDDGADGTHGGAFFHTVMRIVGASDAPLIFVISVFSVFLWAFNMAGNHYFNPGFDGGRATLMLAPVVIGAFVVTRLLVRPLRPLMKMLRTAEKDVAIVGASGVVRSSQLDHEFGEVEVETTERTLILRARLSDESTRLPKGAPILVVSKEAESDTWLVRSLD